MASGWRYRIASILGSGVLTALAIWVAERRAVQETLALLPALSRLPVDAPTTRAELTIEIGVALAVVLAVLLPLYKPQPRRILDTILLAQKRVLVAILALATIGYFDYTYRLPRMTLIATGVLLIVVLPPWFVAIRRPTPQAGERTIIVGDDPEGMAAIVDAYDRPVLGYVSPPSRYTADNYSPLNPPEQADGGQPAHAFDDLNLLGGLSRLEEIIVEDDVDTAILAFTRPDRAEFFGTLDICYEYGVTARVHRDHADVVLIKDEPSSDLPEVDLEPWDWQDYIIKRLFDSAFAVLGLVVLSPVIIAIALAIKLDSSGPVLYSQERTAEFGETITVYKFRSMGAGDETVAPGEETKRVTRVGRILRRTHLDEIPQLWSILTGDMSVVGPRAAWTDEELLLEQEVSKWRQRWFVKPGLTGLAQINNASSETPEEKIRYDIEYIRKQSLWFDLKIVLRQIWIVLANCQAFVRGTDDR